MRRLSRLVDVLALLGCAAFLIVGAYLYFFKGAPLRLFILTVLAFGAGAVISLISLISERETWAIDVTSLSKAKRITLGVGGIMTSICSLWAIFAFAFPMALKIILLISTALLARWSIKLFWSTT